MSRGRNCFVPGCTSGNPNKNKANKERGERNPSLFKAPNDPSLLQQWQKAIPRSDKTLSSKDAVCELHFLDEDILTHYEIKLTDGTISRIERGRPLLKEGSIPRIFPNLPSYFSSNKRKRKPPCVRSEATEKVSNSKKVKGLPINHVENQTSEPNFENENEILRDITNVPVDVTDSRVTMFTNLKNSLAAVGTPNKRWAGTFISGSNEIVFAEWDDTYLPKKTCSCFIFCGIS
ncbi:uncharacterized protein LOC115891353 [Sitophilus oryzae]|uniref:Uncharacterized protein LOC115891353 n=1 Tax=Sitophilus oryzae TaxID=7048 RepID=A0A6J2YWN6_SITOR|nr:uncharacterized protein LOC115891353 [Sitophilus oryzae]